MKEISKNKKKSFLKKIFIKICRILGYEIIDQSNFFVPTQEKSLDENLSLPGKKSIILPLGEVKIQRSVKAFSIIFRSCTKVNMLTQNKKRLFDMDKSEYTFRSLNSIISSLNLAKEKFPKTDFNIIVTDHNSQDNDVEKIKKMLTQSNFESSFISLNTKDFEPNIKKINAVNNEVTKNQISNMSNIHKSLHIAKNECKDLIYFVEDDYIHHIDSITEMIFAYERISSQMNKELILCPIDYPYLYNKIDSTNIFLGSNRHWRVVGETLCTFLTSKIIVQKYWSEFTSMCQYEHYPFEKPLHEIYKKEYCLSPIPSLALHCTNVNSVYGLSPVVNWKKIWDDNDGY